MAFQLADLNGRKLGIIGKISQQSMTATGTFTIFTTPSGTFAAPGGAKLTLIFAVVFDNPTGTSGAITASLGSGTTATDYAGSASITLPTSTAATVIPFIAAGIPYPTALAFNLKITVAGVGACDITALGDIE